MAIRTLSQTIDLSNTSEPVSKYITRIDGYGIRIHPENELSNPNSGQNVHTVQITSNGLDIIKNGQTIASYGNKIIIGDSRGFHIEIGEVGTNNGIPINELGFYHGEGLDNRVAYINDDQLYITKSVVLQQMDVGKLMTNGQDGMWSWKVHKNVNGKNNLYLKWVG